MPSAFKVAVEKLAVNLMGLSVYVIQPLLQLFSLLRNFY
jgi:hypothetical protein